MLDFIGTLVIGATTGMLLVAIASTMVTRLGPRLTLAAIVGAWVGLVAITIAGGVPSAGIFGGLFALPFVVTGVLSAAFPAFRAALFRMPVPLIVGLNTMRVLGALFLVLASVGRLSGPFPYFAGIGDIITGLFALSVARIVARGSVADPRVLIWNAFGALDLLVAVTLGVTSQNASPLQLIHAGVGSAAIVTLPWSMVPLILVPLYLMGHGIVFAQARRHAQTERRGVERPAARPQTAGSIG